MVHFKCAYDPSWDYAKRAKSVFGENKCIVQLEKLGANAHVHFQGMTSLTERMMEDHLNALSNDHYAVVEFKKAYEKWLEVEDNPLKKPSRPRPVKMARRSVDDKGFQYLMKEGTMPMYQQHFTVEELNKLAQKSDEHVEELKNGMKEYLHGRHYDPEPGRAFKRMRLDALEYYEETDKRPRPTFQKDVLWAMYQHPARDVAWKEFVAERI